MPLPPPPHDSEFRSRLVGRNSDSPKGSTLGKLLAVALTLAPMSGAVAQQHYNLPLLMSASDTSRQGFVRVINRSDRAGTVTIHAIDDSGREAGPVTLSLAAKQTVHFNSGELEQGAPNKGLSGRAGSGRGNWRLKLETYLDIEPLAYIRTPADGFLTSIHDVAQGESMRWQVPIFNPGRNSNQKSLLRLINTSGIDTEVTIAGLDDRGNDAPGGDVQFSLPADAARLYSAEDLEDGDSEFEGSLGAGSGKWQLVVSADRPIQVMSLMSTPTGHMTNLSSTTGDTIVRGGPGGDELWGGNGDDIFDPGDNGTSHDLDADKGLDTVHGSMGDDMIIYSRSGEEAFQQLAYADPEGNDHLSGGITVTIDGTANHARVVKGTAGTDTIVDINNPLEASGVEILGTNFNDVFDLTMADGQFINIEAGGGDDTFNVQMIDSGWVRVDYQYAPDGINVDLSRSRASDDGHGDVDTFTGDIPRSVGGSEHSDTISGSDRNEWFFGRGGNDDIDGGGGWDMLQFGYASRFAAYVDITGLQVDLEAGTASGTINGSPFSHTVSNIERLWGATGNDSIRGNIEELRASTGNDTITYTDDTVYASIIYGYLTSGGITATINGPANSATVRKGSAGTDTIVNVAEPLGDPNGGVGLYGTSSNDVFNITLSEDQWIQVGGGAGNDRITMQAPNARIDYAGGAKNGIDIDLRAGRARNDGFGDVDTISGFVSEVRGTDFKDVMRGTNESESFIGRAGDDVIDGRGGFDRVRFDRSAFNAGVEVDLDAGFAKGTWNGEVFTYELTSIESVRGSDGDDSFFGSPENERFRGNKGDDFFIFEGAHGHDSIEDFTNGDDVILVLGLSISKQDVLDHASAWSEGTGVHIDLTSFGGGKIDLWGFRRSDFDASDFLL